MVHRGDLFWSSNGKLRQNDPLFLSLWVISDFVVVAVVLVAIATARSLLFDCCRVSLDLHSTQTTLMTMVVEEKEIG